MLIFRQNMEGLPMKYFIKMWPDKTATLVTNYGKTLMVFESVEEAQRTLRNITNKQTPHNIDFTGTLEHSTQTAA